MEIIFFKGKETHSIELWVPPNNVCGTQLNSMWVPCGPHLNNTCVPPKMYVGPTWAPLEEYVQWLPCGSCMNSTRAHVGQGS